MGDINQNSLTIYTNHDFEEPNIDNLIGTGSYGQVFKLKEKKTGQVFAIKILTDEKEAEDDFFHEISLLCSLSYPTIIRLHGITNVTPKYIITDYIDNSTVQHYINIAREGRKALKWNLQHKLIIILGVCLGMEYLHDQKIVHRDLKPGNILLDSNFYPRICDFGLAKPITTSTITTSVGTLLYRAPEVEKPRYDGYKADVYSYGMTVYSILYDQQPFGNELMSDFDKFSKIEATQRPDLDISFPMEDLIKRCWDQNPDNRPNFHEIKEVLLEELGKMFEEQKIEKDGIKEIQSFIFEFCKIEGKDLPLSLFYENEAMIKQYEDVLMSRFQAEYEQNDYYKRDPKGFTPLHYAAIKNAKEIATILLSNGVDINAKDILY